MNLQNDQTLAQKFNASLMEQLKAARPAPLEHFNVIINFDPHSDWNENIRLVDDAGLHISSQEEAIHVVFGKGTTEVLWRVAAIATVQLIEFDEQAEILRE